MLESGARGSGQKDTTMAKSLEKAGDKFKKFAEIANRGAAGGGRRASNRGYLDTMVAHMGTLTAIGAGVGAMAGGIGAAPAAGVGAAAGFLTGNIHFGASKLKDFFLHRGADKRSRKERGDAIRELYASGAMSSEDYEMLTAKQKKSFLGIDRLNRDQRVNDKLQQKYLEEFAKKSEAYSTAYKDASQLVKSRAEMISRIT